MVPRSKSTKTGQTKSTAKKVKSAGKRELIKTGTDKRFVRRSAKGQFKESDDVGRSLSADRRTKAKTLAPKGQGDRGDQKKAATKTAAQKTPARKGSSAKTSRK